VTLPHLAMRTHSYSNAFRDLGVRDAERCEVLDRGALGGFLRLELRDPPAKCMFGGLLSHLQIAGAVTPPHRPAKFLQRALPGVTYRRSHFDPFEARV
jgi:hypothetical protein